MPHCSADFTNALVDKTQQMALCKYADGVNPTTVRGTFDCKDPWRRISIVQLPLLADDYQHMAFVDLCASCRWYLGGHAHARHACMSFASGAGPLPQPAT